MKYTVLAVAVATALLTACGGDDTVAPKVVTGANAAELIEGGQLVLLSF